MKKDRTSLEVDSLNTPFLNEKKKWIEPQISAWEYVNLGLKSAIVGGVDAGSKTSTF
ncbi:hypothetical protein [Aquirufa nivalisilvae]